MVKPGQMVGDFPATQAQTDSTINHNFKIYDEFQENDEKKLYIYPHKLNYTLWHPGLKMLFFFFYLLLLFF